MTETLPKKDIQTGLFSPERLQCQFWVCISAMSQICSNDLDPNSVGERPAESDVPEAIDRGLLDPEPEPNYQGSSKPKGPS